MTEIAEDARRADELAAKIRPMLIGHGPDVVGACVAELTATFLAGNLVRGHPEETNSVREELLKMHVEAVRKLVPLMEKLYVEPQLKRQTQ